MSRTKGSVNGVNNRKDHANPIDPATGRPQMGRKRNDPTTTIAEQRALQAARHINLQGVRGNVYTANVRTLLPMWYAHCDADGVRVTDYELLYVNSRGRVTDVIADDAEMGIDDILMGLVDADCEDFGGFGEPLRLDRQYWMDTNL